MGGRTIAVHRIPDPDAPQDQVIPLLPRLAQGYIREVALREGLILSTEDYQMRDRSSLAWSEEDHWMRFHCHLSGDHQDPFSEVGNLEYALYGSGMPPKRIETCSGQFPIVEVTVTMSQEMFLNFAGKQGILPLEFQHLIGTLNQPIYARVGALSPAMQGVLWQIIRCPYCGLMKRMYLECKALELATLILEQEQ